MDSGAVDHTIHPEDVPHDVVLTPNTDNKHFTNASGGKMKCHGSCETIMTTNRGKQVKCPYKVVDVSRPLHSVTHITGPEDDLARAGFHDVLMNNKKAVLVPPGIVDKILKVIEPILQYDRDGGLYTTEVELQRFGRQGATQ